MLEKFTVIDLIKSRSASILTVNGNSVKLNTQTQTELGNPEYIQFLVNPKDKQIAIRGCKENDEGACLYCKGGVASKYAYRAAQPAVVAMIRKLTGWGEKESWNVPAVYFADEKALIYDLSAAFAPAAKKGGWAAKRENEAAAVEAARNLADNT